MAVTAAALRHDGKPLIVGRSLDSLADLSQLLPVQQLTHGCKRHRIFSPSEYGDISCRMITSGRMSITEAIPQLGLSLSVRAYLLNRLYDVPAADVIRYGWVHLPQDKLSHGSSNPYRPTMMRKEQQQAQRDWGFRLEVREL